MNVLIKGMEMPKNCGDCNFYYVDYEEGTANCLATSCYVQPLPQKPLFGNRMIKRGNKTHWLAFMKAEVSE